MFSGHCQDRRYGGTAGFVVCGINPGWIFQLPGQGNCGCKKNSGWVAMLGSSLFWWGDLRGAGSANGGLRVPCPILAHPLNTTRLLPPHPAALPDAFPSQQLELPRFFPSSTARSSLRVVNYCCVAAVSPLAPNKALNIIKHSVKSWKGLSVSMYLSPFYCWHLKDFNSRGMSLSLCAGGVEGDGQAGLGCAGFPGWSRHWDPPGQVEEILGRWDSGYSGAEGSMRRGL